MLFWSHWLYHPPSKTASGKQCCREDEELRKEAAGTAQRAGLVKNWLPTQPRQLGRLLR